MGEEQVQVPGGSYCVGGRCRDCFVPLGRKDRIVTKSSVPSRAVHPDPCPVSLRITFSKSESGLEASFLPKAHLVQASEGMGEGVTSGHVDLDGGRPGMMETSARAFPCFPHCHLSCLKQGPLLCWFHFPCELCSDRGSPLPA